ncbi:FIG00546255: Oxidoreductase, FAD-binding protein [hydrothermal vent metagenome]|uniref:FIG00546255: Oxidoreductase, FAD-binding protein n=1 Tax=hydrothermal vent metagenome TaxID=652676 RepID=A0A3B0YDH5_9ZZZZ
METEIHNWGKDIYSYPSVVTQPNSVDEIIKIVKDTQQYPSPVKAVGSNHSTSHCAVSDQGTLVDMTKLNKIIKITADTVTTQAGALYLDVNQALEKEGKQFYVNLELGNLSMGSACTCGTKDASMPGEAGQVCSYASVIKVVSASGELLEFNEDDLELLRFARSSYGMIGIVYEVTFKIHQLKPMTVYHENYTLDSFLACLPELVKRQQSIMLYMFPHEDKVTVEFRHYHEGSTFSRRYVWRLRNWTWVRLTPLLGWFVTKYIPWPSMRYFCLKMYNKIQRMVLRFILHGKNTSASAQMIRYPNTSGRSGYTFSIWTFAEDKYPDILRGYFQFCKEYYRKHNYRCDMLNVGYRVEQDQASLLSYSVDSTVLTLDPVSTGSPGWNEFLRAYNHYCSEQGGIPLFNQTKWLTPKQARKAFGDRIDIVKTKVQQYDPHGRFLNEFFRERIFDS